MVLVLLDVVGRRMLSDRYANVTHVCVVIETGFDRLLVGEVSAADFAAITELRTCAAALSDHSSMHVTKPSQIFWLRSFRLAKVVCTILDSIKQQSLKWREKHFLTQPNLNFSELL